jgi:hypothetical protein
MQGKAPVQPRTAQPVQPAPPINMAPSGGPSDIFKPPPSAPAPQQVVPPQPKAQSAEVSDATNAVLLDFDPAYIALAPGQQQSILVRATSAGGLPPTTLRIRFDPNVVAAVVAKPILGGGTGVADATITAGQVMLQFSGSEDLSGTRAIGEIILRGVGTGRASLSFEPVEIENTSVTFSQAVVDVR